MRSENVGSIYLTSADPERGRTWVELDKSNKAKGEMVMLRADGGILYDNWLKQIKGRGNSTWLYPKQPYQIKLNKATDLLETVDPAEKEKTWLLLANALDNSLIRNEIT